MLSLSPSEKETKRKKKNWLSGLEDTTDDFSELSPCPAIVPFSHLHSRDIYRYRVDTKKDDINHGQVPEEGNPPKVI